MMNTKCYKTWVFDCDGVVLDSNRIKTDAFFRAAEPYGAQYARQLADYHVKNGGISRYIKFQHFITGILGRESVDEAELSQLLSTYAEYVKQGLLSCDAAPGIDRLRQLTKDSNWLIVSGGDQAELRSVFSQRGLDHLFDGGIYGSPDTKDEILSRLKAERVIDEPAVFVGDSQYDIEAARRASLDFIFVSDWSESSFDFRDADMTLGSIAAIADQF
jgi:HAD superfamily hydrolase (TIGR01549 family)